MTPEEQTAQEDSAFKQFFDHLGFSFPGKVPDSFLAFRHHCEQRERDGRTTFGDSYLGRDNILESLEELGDFGIYMYLDHRKEIREGVEDDDISLVLQACFFAYQAYDCARQLAAKRRGSP
jgi:hypothetical protein